MCWCATLRVRLMRLVSDMLIEGPSVRAPVLNSSLPGVQGSVALQHGFAGPLGALALVQKPELQLAPGPDLAGTRPKHGITIYRTTRHYRRSGHVVVESSANLQLHAQIGLDHSARNPPSPCREAHQQLQIIASERQLPGMGILG